MQVRLKRWFECRPAGSHVIAVQLYSNQTSQSILPCDSQGRNERGTMSRAPNHWGARICPNNVASTFFKTVHSRPKDLGFEHGVANVASTFFKTVHSRPKDLGFEHGVAKLVSCSRRHLISLRPWWQLLQLMFCWCYVDVTTGSQDQTTVEFA